MLCARLLATGSDSARDRVQRLTVNTCPHENQTLWERRRGLLLTCHRLEHCSALRSSEGKMMTIIAYQTREQRPFGSCWRCCDDVVGNVRLVPPGSRCIYGIRAGYSVGSCSASRFISRDQASRSVRRRGARTSWQAIDGSADVLAIQPQTAVPIHGEGRMQVISKCARVGARNKRA